MEKCAYGQDAYTCPYTDEDGWCNHPQAPMGWCFFAVYVEDEEV